MKSINRVYNVSISFVAVCFYAAVMFLQSGCAVTLTASQKKAKRNEIVESINAARAKEDLEPLQVDDTLCATAFKSAQEAARRGSVQQEDNRLHSVGARGEPRSPVLEPIVGPAEAHHRDVTLDVGPRPRAEPVRLLSALRDELLSFLERAARLAATLQLARQLNPDTAQFYPLMVYPGTEAYELAQRDGSLQSTDYQEWLTPDGLHSTVIDQPGLTASELLAWCDQARRSFYLRPGYVISKARQMLMQPQEAGRIIRSARAFSKYLLP